MKIITFQGGLGNQLFEYAYYLFLRKKYPHERFYGLYPTIAMNQHYGLEINKWFEVSLPKENWFSKTMGYFLYRANRWLLYRNLPGIFCNSDKNIEDSKLLVFGYWQDKQFVNKVTLPQFRSDLKINVYNKDLLTELQKSNAVAVHVRRGDYTQPSVQALYGGICTPNYYKNAIKKAQQDIKDAVFYFFSDEPDYVEQNFVFVENKVIVSGNKGEDSFFDMYLMAHAKNMILANSTFSCWAAYLNNDVKIVYCPQRWINREPIPDLIKEEWIVIKSE